jgi:hypothetical protein
MRFQISAPALAAEAVSLIEDESFLCVALKDQYRILNKEFRMLKECIQSIFIKKTEPSETILRNSAVEYSTVLRFAV